MVLLRGVRDLNRDYPKDIPHFEYEAFSQTLQSLQSLSYYLLSRLILKNFWIKERDSSAKTPPLTAIFVLNRGSPHN